MTILDMRPQCRRLLGLQNHGIVKWSLLSVRIIVFLGFILAIASVALIPVLVFFNGVLAQTCATALAAATLATTAVHMQPQAEEIGHLRPMLPRLFAVAMLPAAWMLAQTLPLGALGLGHPIWSSVRTGLGSSLTASLSVDPGITLVALGHYAGFIALGLAVSIITVARRNAEWMLFALLAVSATAALLVLFRSDIVAESSGFAQQSETSGSALTIVAIGCVIAVAAAARAYERGETRNLGSIALIGAAPGLAISGIVFLLCVVALTRIGKGYMIAATGVGLGIFAAVLLVRRLGFGVWGVIAISIAALAIAITVFSQGDITHSTDPLLAFVGPAKTGSAELAARMLADVRWSGSGAGTFDELAELYRDISDTTTNTTSRLSSVVIIAIELGRPALIFIGIGVAVVVGILLRATIKRGRDSFFPAAGAASILILSIAAFGDRALLTPAVAMLASVITGLGLAQSAGRARKQ